MAWFTNIHWLRKPIFQSKYLSALIYMYIHTTYKNTYIHLYERVDQIDIYNTPRGCDCGQPHELCKI